MQNDSLTPQKKSLSPVAWVAIIIGILFMLCICTVIAGAAAYFLVSPSMAPDASYEVTRPETNLPSVSVTPIAPPEWLSGDDNLLDNDERTLANAIVPPRDIPTLGVELRGLSGVPTTISREPFQIGDVETFYVTNDDTESTVEVSASLVYIAENVYMWVQQGLDYDQAALKESADEFSDRIVPTNRENFGMEVSPGVDNDPRLHILHSDELGSQIAGYFGSSDAYPEAYANQSNEKEMFYINISNTFPGTDDYLSTLAHEYQHMIHWSTDRNETTWLNEGMSEMASYLNGFGPSWFAAYYFGDPAIQLTTWPEEDSSLPYYGGAYLFAQYFHDRFGIEATRALVANDQNGLASVDNVLESIGSASTADEVFMDWTIANLLDDPAVTHPLSGEDGLYAYDSLDVGELTFSSSLSHITPYAVLSDLPIRDQAFSVNQYGAEYIPLEMTGDIQIDFDGDDFSSLIPADTEETDGDAATDDRFVWWSNRGDDSSMTLSHEFDLTGVETATLTYDIWYWLEEGWDFGYLEVSTDGGQTYETIRTPYTTDEDPFGNNYGNGYTGRSINVDEDADGWLQESIDLSEYADQLITIRFQQINDDAVNQPGFAIDNIQIPEIGFSDNVEEGEGEWETGGFARIINLLHQRFAVHLVTLDHAGNAEVFIMPLDQANAGSLTATIPSGGSAYLVISGLTGFTTQPTSYILSIQ